ncbi:hypothetical protein F4861DRAFT_512463 [Xylaria intraflava]|nr:hypothetical protein F4861DRAFT_512463 [Xylaria intraflava]
MAVGGIVSLVLGSVLVNRAITDAASSPESPNELAMLDNKTYSLNKKAAVYGREGVAPYLYLNHTLTSATLTVTVTAVNVTTETIVPSLSVVNQTAEAATGSGFLSTVTNMVVPSLSIVSQPAEATTTASFPSTVTDTVTVTITPYGPFYGQTATDNCPCTLASATEDAEAFSATSSVPSSVTTVVSTVSSSVDVCSIMASYDDSTLSPVPTTTALPTITMTTTIQYSTSDSEEYTSTETVTVTPYVTITDTITSTLPTTTKTSITDNAVTKTGSSVSVVTVTVYVTPTLTQAQTSAIGASIATGNIATSQPVAATITQTVVPIPISTSTTTLTDFVVASSDTAVSSASPYVTVITTQLTSTVMGKFGNLTSTMDGSPNMTVVTYTTAFSFTVTPGAANATWTKLPVAASNTVGADMVSTMLSATRKPVPVSGTVSWSVVPIETAGSATVTVPSSADAYSTPTYNPSRSGAGSDKKLPATVFWGGNNGGGTGMCVMMLVAIVSLIQVFVM